MRDEEYVNNQCVALAAYVASCHKFNICIEWRSPDYCRKIYYYVVVTLVSVKDKPVQGQPWWAEVGEITSDVRS